jgi:hypothetical protein
MNRGRGIYRGLSFPPSWRWSKRAGAAAARGLLAEPAGIDAAIAIDHIARSLARDLLPEIAVKAS